MWWSLELIGWSLVSTPMSAYCIDCTNYIINLRHDLTTPCMYTVSQKVTHFTRFNIFYNNASTGMKSCMLIALATKWMSNFPLHPSYVPSLPENETTRKSNSTRDVEYCMSPPVQWQFQHLLFCDLELWSFDLSHICSIVHHWCKSGENPTNTF